MLSSMDFNYIRVWYVWLIVHLNGLQLYSLGFELYIMLYRDRLLLIWVTVINGAHISWNVSGGLKYNKYKENYLYTTLCF